MKIVRNSVELILVYKRETSVNATSLPYQGYPPSSVCSELRQVSFGTTIRQSWNCQRKPGLKLLLVKMTGQRLLRSLDSPVSESNCNKSVHDMVSRMKPISKFSRGCSLIRIISLRRMNRVTLTKHGEAFRIQFAATANPIRFVNDACKLHSDDYFF